jgi:hypothetical protein
MANGNGNKQMVVYRPRAPQRNNKSNGKRQITTQIARTQSQAALQNNNGNSRTVKSRRTDLDGSDFVTTLKVKGSSELITAQDRILLKQVISASSFPGTRVTALSELWERYRWLNAEMRYVPAVPNTIACQLIAYIDTDPLDDPSTILDVDQLLRQATAQLGAKQWNFNTTKSIPLITRKDDQLYYTGLDKLNPRFSQQGVLYILQVTDLLNLNGVKIETGFVAGSMFIDWRVQFSMPQINPSVDAASINDYELYLVATDSIGVGTNTITFSGLDNDLSYLAIPAGAMEAGGGFTDFDSEWGSPGSQPGTAQFRLLNSGSALSTVLMDGFVATKPTNGSITLSTQTIMIGQASLDFNLYGIRLAA